MAGPIYADLSRLIERYEEAQDLNDEARRRDPARRDQRRFSRATTSPWRGAGDHRAGQGLRVRDRAHARAAKRGGSPPSCPSSASSRTSSYGGSGWRRGGMSWAGTTSRSSRVLPGRGTIDIAISGDSEEVADRRRRNRLERNGKGTPGSRRPGSSSSIRCGPRTSSPARRARPSKGTRAAGSAPGAVSGNERSRGFRTSGWFHQARIRSSSRPWG